jgi:hypothetical protein
MGRLNGRPPFSTSPAIKMDRLGSSQSKDSLPSLTKHPQHPSIWAISSDGIPQILTHARTHTHIYTPTHKLRLARTFQMVRNATHPPPYFPPFPLIIVTHTPLSPGMAGACLDGSSITRKRHIDKTPVLPRYLCSYASGNGGERCKKFNPFFG